MCGKFNKKSIFLAVVDRVDSLQELSIVTNLAGSKLKCLNILWKTTSAISTAWVYKMVADSRIGTYLANFLDICTEKFCNICQFVHKADLRGKHGIGRIFRKFCTLDIHEHSAFMITVNG